MAKRIDNSLVSTEAAKFFSTCGAFRTGHFVLSSGKHSNIYFNKRVVSDNVRTLEVACKMLVQLINVDVDVIVSPEAGAIPFGERTAELLSEKLGHHVDYVTAQKFADSEGFFIADEDAELVEGAIVGIVEDVFTTGKSTAQTVNAVYHASGSTRIIVGLLERGGGEVREILPTIPIGALMEIDAVDFTEVECHERGLCMQGVPICTEPKIGHGDEYVAKHGQPPYRDGYAEPD